MRIITKTYAARVLSKPSVVVNLLEFKQKPLMNGNKSLENGWEVSLGDYFDVDSNSKTIVLPKDRQVSPHIVVIETNKENQKAIFKDVQLAFKLAKKIK